MEQDNTTSEVWEGEILVALNSAASRLKFNWQEISVFLREYAQSNSSHSALTINAAICREVYAQNFIHLNKGDHVTTAIASMHAEGPNIEELTLEELIKHVDKKEQELDRKKQQIFQRVLDSLGGSSVTATFNDAVTSAYSRAQETKELDRLKRIQIQKEAEERRMLEQERAKLRSRFAPGSVDEEGENPLAHEKVYNDEEEFLKTLIQAENFATVGGTVSDKFDGFFESEALDELLTELESQFACEAADKIDGNLVNAAHTLPTSNLYCLFFFVM
jgi:hypothetical protein